MQITRVREYTPLKNLPEEAVQFCRKVYIDDNPDTPPLVRNTKNGGVVVQNYVGSLPVGKKHIVEIYPKIPLMGGISDDISDKEKAVFYSMLRHYRRTKSPILDKAAIEKLKHYPLWEVFISLFLRHVQFLVRRGIAHHYQAHTDNLPYMKGRLLFPQHTVINSTNKARFYVQYDEYTPNRAANRLIRKALDIVASSCKLPENQRLRRQLATHFGDIPASSNIGSDWQQYQQQRSSRLMRYYDDTMHWVELLLRQFGLATYQGDTRAPSLLFPMQDIFEDFVAHHVRRHAGSQVQTQGPKKKMMAIGSKKYFAMRPDIYFMRRGEKFIIDAKWKEVNIRNHNYDMSQGDLYQLFSYGKFYGCAAVALLYPKNENFKEPLDFEYSGQELPLLCFPFDIENAAQSARDLVAKLEKFSCQNPAQFC